jgi:hypothetical protein
VRDGLKAVPYDCPSMTNAVATTITIEPEEGTAESAKIAEHTSLCELCVLRGSFRTSTNAFPW